MIDNISKKLFEIQNDQTGEIITEKFMFGGAADDVRYCFIMGRKDLDTGKITLASTIVTAQITLSKNLLILNLNTKEILSITDIIWVISKYSINGIPS